MGGKASKFSTERQFSHSGSAASTSNSLWDQYVYPQSPYNYPQQSPYYTPRHSHESSPSLLRNLDRRYSRIADNYRSLDEVTSALAHAGLESSNLIVGIDFTKSNEWTGSRSFKRRSLHHIGNGQNPYEQAISIIGRTLSVFDEDNLIPCFGFGDASTHDQDVFSFYPNERFCNGFEDVLSRYRGIVPHLRLAGPTSFAPIIDMAVTIVEQSSGQYHVLLIIADGQVTRSVDTQNGRLSPQEQKTIDAIVRASEYPLSIILVGVGDGPWDMMREFDDNIPTRAFDNFQFVNFTEIMSENVDPLRKQTDFALSALMEIPSQYKATIELGLLGRQTGNAPERVPLPPPVDVTVSSNYNTTRPQHSTSTSQQSTSAPYAYDAEVNKRPTSTSFYDNQVCPICLTNPKDMAFGCGHQMKLNLLRNGGFSCVQSLCRWMSFFEELNFGFGKPIWVSVPSCFYKNGFILMDTNTGDGIGAIVRLELLDMAVFGHDQELLTFASSNPRVLGTPSESFGD